MTRVSLVARVEQDVVRILDHLEQHDVPDAPARIRALHAALRVLETSPLIGRPIAPDLRELIIGRESHGYVALYRYLPTFDRVLVLALRSQRESGYRLR